MKSEILLDLKGENNRAFGQLYKEYFGMVNRYIVNNNGQNEDALDIFQDTMLVLVEKLRNDEFQLTASIKTYIMAIAKNLWLKRLRNKAKNYQLSENNQLFDEINFAIEQEKTFWDKLQNYMHHISDHCKGLIHKMFFRNNTIEQIQKEYGYSTKHNAQNQKHKCVEQIRKVRDTEEGKERK